MLALPSIGSNTVLRVLQEHRKRLYCTEVAAKRESLKCPTRTVRYRAVSTAVANRDFVIVIPQITCEYMSIVDALLSLVLITTIEMTSPVGSRS